MTVPINKDGQEEGQARLPSVPSTASPSPVQTPTASPFPAQPPNATENSFLTQNEEFETYFDNEKIHIPESENVRMIYVHITSCLFVNAAV